MKYVWLAALALAASCSKSNSEACCTSEADCTAVGLPIASSCPSGQGCSDHACVTAQCTGDSDCSAPTPVCSASLCVTCDATHGCAASEPVCSIDMMTCTTCGDDTDCTAFAGASKCDRMSGACVQCVTTADCETAMPVCDTGTCRACNVDADCDSGACALDGTCVAATAALYVAPTGADAGTCPQTLPCATLTFAATQLSSTVRDIVIAPGTYAEQATLSGGTATIGVHGGGATLSPAATGSTVITTNATPVLIRNVTISGTTMNPGGTFDTGLGKVTLRSVAFDHTSDISVHGPVDAQDLKANDAQIVVTGAGDLTIDRAVLTGGTSAIRCQGSAATGLHLTNVMISGTSAPGLSITTCTGSVDFSTIADTDTGDSTAGTQIACGTVAIDVTSSIIAGPTGATSLVTGSCSFTTSIAEPMSVSGAMNVDPMFVGRAAGDYHISSGSPAKDAVTTGPPDDFEGDARPQGAGYDIGADEAPP